MLIKTNRLAIRDVKTEDGVFFIDMAADGSLTDCGFDKACNEWMEKWIDEAKELAIRDNPNIDYLAYTIALKNEKIVIGSIGCSYYEDINEIGITYFIGAQYRNKRYAVEAVNAYLKYFFDRYTVQKMIATIRAENISSWKVIEKAGFILTEKRMYRDVNDDSEVMYHFYKIYNFMK